MSGDLPDKPAGTPSSAPPPAPDSSALSSPVAATPSPATNSISPAPPVPQPLQQFLAQSAQFAARAAPPPIYAPNRVLPRFIRLLALYVFLIGGTLGAATAWFYQSVLYPRLVKRLEMITKLNQHGLVTYEAFEAALKRMAEGKGFRMIRPQASEGAVEEATQTNENAEVEDVHDDREEAAQDKDTLLAEAEPTAEPTRAPAPAILAPLTSSLAQLSSALATKPTPFPSSDAFPSLSSTLQTPQRALKPLNVALLELSSFIETQSLATNSLAYRPYAGYPSSGASTPGLTKKQLELREVVNGLKGEIRSVKGVLLNRRNFAALGPREQ